MRFKKLVLTLAATYGFFIAQHSAWATCSNYTTYADGQVLTAGSLNSLQTNYTNCVNAVLDGDNFTGDINLYSAANLKLYSDTGTTLQASVNGTTGKAILGITQAGQMSNCGLSYSAGTLTINGDDGTALSASNPCLIGIKSNTSNRVALARFTANVTVTDGSSSQTDGNLFGITDADWANVMPLFVGVVYNGTTPYFTLSRVPLVTTGSAATDVCQLNDTDCDGQTDAMILTTGLTLASWVNLPVTQVGWIKGTYATSGGAWTFSLDRYTGFNDTYESQRFTFPQAQMGAASSTHFLANGGTAPVWSSDIEVYEMKKDGRVKVENNAANDGGTDGSGAVAAQVALPFTFLSGAIDDQWRPCGLSEGATTISSGPPFIAVLTESTSYFTMRYLDASAIPTSVTNAMFSNGSRNMRCVIDYNTLSN